MTPVLAFDIGGANLKIAHSTGWIMAEAFPLWQQCQELPGALRAAMEAAPPADILAVTMTGELADCFTTKAEGVAAILAAVEEVAGGREVLVYQCSGDLVAPNQARHAPLLTAASNWHVLASFAARYCDDAPGLLLDLGSTTCDLIPLHHGQPTTTGHTDTERLQSRELVYTGVERSPLCGLVTELPWQDGACPLALEQFATTLDVYLLLDELPAAAHNCHTADGRPRTKTAAHARLARCLCADTQTFFITDALRAARAVRQAQLERLDAALQTVLANMPSPPSTIVLSGQGEFLLRELVGAACSASQVVSLAERLGPEASRAACAIALAHLTAERVAPRTACRFGSSNLAEV